jgi:aspartate/methionine/tyrosine aminotransferase
MEDSSEMTGASTIACMRFHAPYLEWAKRRPSPRFDLAGSNVLACSLDDLPGARNALELSGRNDNGYQPLTDAIAQKYGVSPSHVTTATGASEANFLVCAALLEPGDEVLVERPGYDPLLGAVCLLNAVPTRFERRFDEAFAINAERVGRAMTSRTRLVILTNPHNPTSAVTSDAALLEIGRRAEAAGAHVLVDEVYLDASPAERVPAATLGDVFITTSSLTKSYGLASLRCGWTLSSPAVAERIRRARDVVDGTGSIVVERLSTLAFTHLEALAARAGRLLRENHEVMHDFLRRRRDLEWVDPGGGTILFPRIRGVSDSRRFCDHLLEDRETAVVPGRFFEAPAHFRIHVGGRTDVLRGGLSMIGEALDAQAY